MSEATTPRAASPADFEQALADTRRAQSDAADPSASAWVRANAGTGKTYVLTRRVMRLLLAGTAPDRILCLTYTKAAAAEMSTRVFRELGFWVTSAPSDLQAKLTDLLGRVPSPQEQARARTLFAAAIETPGGLKVQTIHSFCERLLQRFPLEAGVPPGFAILDDVSARELLQEAIDDTLTRATRAPGSPLGQALRTTVAHAVDDTFDKVLAEALARRDWLEHVMRRIPGEDDNEATHDPVAAIAGTYRAAFSLLPGDTVEACDDISANLLDASFCRAAAAILADGQATDIKLADALLAAASATSDTDRAAAFARGFLNKDGGAFADRFITKAIRHRDTGLAERLTRARDELATAVRKRRALDVIDATLALIRLADSVLTGYAALKARRAALDFDDLIRRAANLLGTSQAAQWVLYKLDGGLDHILVDESQDTSPEQWRIVSALAAEFFAGAGNHETPPTVFAVGDEKQSIYSFQGARPEAFESMGAKFKGAAEGAGATWREIPLHLSFRTVAPILEAVDDVFADVRRAPGLAHRDNEVEHAVSRIGDAGLVEIWETEKPEDESQLDVWQPGVVREETISPAQRLATRIADRIKAMLDNGEMLPAADRPITAGDILILLRKRNPLAKPIVAALKARGIPVAGADRLRLTEQLAVQDLMVLGDFLTLPEDDLALATVLKSPLIGLDDDDLLDIAHGRRGSLWKSLLDKRRDKTAYDAACARLSDWRRRADFMPPYEFLASLLDRDGMRQRILARLGPEAADSLDELVNLAIAFDESAPPSLTGFLASLRAADREIKRDMEHGRDEVRIMTVHGAKGLEAPIVFMPDTCSTKSVGRRPSLYALACRDLPVDAPEPFVWQTKGASKLPEIAEGRARYDEAEREERNRLLYVAMTRARDRLYVGGFETRKRKRPQDSWYDLILEGLSARLVATTDTSGDRVRRLSCEQTRVPEKKKTPEPGSGIAPPPAVIALPEWANRLAPKEPQLTVPLAPSRLAPYETDDSGEPAVPAVRPERGPGDEPPALSPRMQADGHRFLRGTLTHALLEHLPAFPPDTWNEAARAFVARRGLGLSTAVRRSIVHETLAVLKSPGLEHLFGPASRAEVAVSALIPRPGGRGPALRLTGQIDRLAIDGDTVFIIDYKTNRPPPARAEDIADAYLYQLASYRLALAEMFPGKVMQAAILWTDGPRLMPIPDTLIAHYERRLWTIDAATLDAGNLDVA